MDLLDRFLSVGEAASLSKLTVRLVHEKSCFVSLPANLSAKLLASHRLPLALHIAEAAPTGGWRNESSNAWHVAWAGASCSTRGIIEVPAALARCLNLNEGTSLSVQPLPQVPNAESLIVEPASEDDWELVEIHAGFMEEQLLNQVGLAVVGEPFPFWVSNQTPLYLRVRTAEPASIVKLTRGLELSVAPRPRQRPQQAGKEGRMPDEAPALRDVSWLRLEAVEEADLVALRRASNSQASTPEADFGWLTTDTSTLRLTSQTASECKLSEDNFVAVAAHRHGRPTVLRLTIEATVAPVHAQVPASILACSQLQNHESAALWFVPQLGQAPEQLVLHPLHDSPPPAIAALQSMNSAALQALITSWVKAQTFSFCSESLPAEGSHAHSSRGVPMQDGSIIVLKRDPTEEPLYLFVEVRAAVGQLKPGGAFILCSHHVERGMVNFVMGEPVDIPGWRNPEVVTQQRQDSRKLLSFGEHWVRNYLEPCLHRVLPKLHHPSRKAWWRAGAPPPGGLLICGSTGSGMTALASLLGAVLQNHPDCRTHVVHVDCQTVETDSLNSAKEELAAKIREARACMPSLLVLDKLHLLCPAPSDAPESGSSVGTAALVQWLADVIDHFREQVDDSPPLPVVVAATSPSPSEVASQLTAPGRLDYHVTLQHPGTEERCSLLEASLSARKIAFSQAELQAVAAKADSFDEADLQAFVDRAIHAAATRLIRLHKWDLLAEPLRISQGDWNAALENFIPAAGWGVGKGQGSATVSGWDDVGGLHDVRAVLLEALELPAKFSKLLSKAPLRLRTGVLLYGPPGCGKTHVIIAAAAACGARFLGVKGPELLNKYIGASEAAVRDVFRQASAAAPCVLFLDEFDAIAPQRGHDSTGVTDRVVNQLLTELDGVEGLKGVVVLAATSRPDLLDAALLRPGRLDRLMYCGMPNRKDRLSILRALSRKLLMAPDIELPEVASRTDNFTGADLGALLADAQLAAVQDLLRRPVDNEGKGKGSLISSKHLLTALRTAHPSLSQQERRRLEAIYNRFRSSRESGIPDRDAKGKTLRATLA